MSKSDAGECRQAPRRLARLEVCLQASLLILDTTAREVGPFERPLILYGTTHDLSDSGVTVIIANVKIDKKFCEEEHFLPTTLFLPNGQVKMEISPVRCTLLNAGLPDEAYLMAAKISRISDRRRERLLQYLSTPA
jgi:hypothetical protein